MFTALFKNYYNMLKEEFFGYNRQKLQMDLLAGCTVAAVALPVALAFGVASGATAQAGIVTAVAAGILIGGLSGTSFSISGPTGAMSAILITLVARHGLQGVFLASVMAGILMIALAFMRGGRLITVIPMPVIAGFTSGIALTIILSQLDNFFGVHSQGASPLAKILSYGELGFVPELNSVLIGTLTMVLILFWPKRWNQRLPGSLIAIVISTLVSVLLGMDMKRVGELPMSLLGETQLKWSDFDLDLMADMFSAAISIAMLSMIESLLCGSSGSRMSGKAFQPDVELFAQGIGSIVIPFLGGVPPTAGIARTSVGIKSGMQTRMTSIFHALALLCSIFILSPVMSKIPLASLAGVLFVTAWRMNEWGSIRFILSHHFKTAVIQFVITMLVTVLFDLTAAILVGVMFSIIMLVVNLANIEINSAEVDLNKVSGYDELDLSLFKKTVVVYISGPIIFTCVDKIKANLKQYQDTEIVILSLRGVPLIDISGLQTIEDFCDELLSHQKRVIFSSLQPKVRAMFERAGLVQKYGEDNFYWSVERVLADKSVFARQEHEEVFEALESAVHDAIEDTVKHLSSEVSDIER